MPRVDTVTIVVAAGALGAGAAIGWLLRQARAQREQAAAARDLAVADERLAATQAARDDLAARLAVAEAATAGERQRAAQAEVELARVRQAVEALTAAAGEREQLAARFGAIAGEAMRANAAELARQHHERLDGVVRPLGEHLTALQGQVQRIREQDVKERAGLGEQLARLEQMNARLNVEADRLANALRGQAKVRGDYGEHILQVVLESAGLDAGVIVRLQESHRDGDGALLRPDAIVNMPGGRALVVDAKLTLNPWTDYANAPEDGREDLRAAYIASVKARIDELGRADYQRLADLATVDYVLMFIPIEPAYLEAVRPEHRLYAYAMQRKVVLVGSTTLLATLATVRHVWVHEKQSRNYAEIARVGEQVVRQVERFLEHFAKVDAALRAAADAFEEARKRLHTGRGSLVSSAQRLTRLGIKADAMAAKGAAQLGLTLDDEDDAPAGGEEPAQP